MSGSISQIFDEYGEALVRLLAVPIIPPRRLFFPKRCASYMSPVLSDPMDLTNDCRAITINNTKKREANEYSRNHKSVEIGVDYDTTIAYFVRSITFIDLPTELHLRIMCHIDSIDDLVCLSLTSRYFLDVCQKKKSLNIMHHFRADGPVRTLCALVTRLNQATYSQVYFLGEN